MNLAATTSTTKKSRALKRRRWRRSVLLGALVSAALVPLAAFGWKDLYSRFFEMIPPLIVVVEPISGVGAVPQQMVVEVSDLDSGVAAVSVEASQDDRVFVLTPPLLLHNKKHERFTLNLSGRESGLSPGPLTIKITATDGSLWANRHAEAISLVVNYEAPTIKPYTVLPPATRGGTGITFFSAVSSAPLLQVGVESGDFFFPAFPARVFDPIFQDDSLYVSLFSFPAELEARENSNQTSRARIIAEDASGNATAREIPFQPRSITVTDEYQDVTSEYLTYRVDAVFESSAHEVMALAQDDHASPFSYKTTAVELTSVERLRLLIKYLLPLSDARLSQIATSQRFERFWNRPLARPEGHLLGGLDRRRIYRFKGTPIESTLMRGIDVVTTKSASEVKALAKGVVLKVGEMSGYGRFVALDHGIGLVTLYASLGTITVDQGQLLESGAPLGTPLAIAGSDRDASYHVHVFLNGVPVNINEWLDPEWYANSIVVSTIATKRKLGLPLFQG